MVQKKMLQNPKNKDKSKCTGLVTPVTQVPLHDTSAKQIPTQVIVSPKNGRKHQERTPQIKDPT